MADFDDYLLTDGVDYPLAAHVMQLRNTSFRSEYVNTESISATKELTDNDLPYQVITCSTTDRIIELPVEATSNHPFLIYNTTTSSDNYTLTVKDDSGATTYASLVSDQWAEFKQVNGEGWKITASDPLQSPTINTPIITSATGIGQTIFTKKAADETVTTSTTLQDDDDFTFSIGANEVWFVELWLSVVSPGTGTDFKFAFDAPAGASVRYEAAGTGNVGWAATSTGSSPTALTTSILGNISVGSISGTHGIPIFGIFVNNAVAGSITFRWAQNTSSGSTTVEAESFMKRTRIA